jgi:heterodisulfide reductase subunit C
MEAKVVFEGRSDPKFFETLADSPEGERLRSCLQCGTCGGSCPVSSAMKHTPRQLIAMIRAGLKSEVLQSITPWICASCYSCTVNCPAGIKITELMYALKRMAGRSGILPPDSDAIRFVRLFTESVCDHGRASELPVLMKYMMFHHPARMMGQSGSGLTMMLRGRMPVVPHSIAGLTGFKKMVECAEKLEESAS